MSLVNSHTFDSLVKNRFFIRISSQFFLIDFAIFDNAKTVKISVSQNLSFSQISYEF